MPTGAGYSGFSKSSLMAFFVAPNVLLAETNPAIGLFFDFVRNGFQHMVVMSSASQAGKNAEVALKFC
jgi:hypothetical protein